MWRYLIYFAVAFAIFLVIDMVWLGVIAKSLYRQELGHLMGARVNFIAAFVFYALFIVGALYFVIIPGLESGNVPRLILSAALYGLITYATYDLTNLATLRDWPLRITLIDLTWGTTLSTVTSLLSYWVLSRIY